MAEGRLVEDVEETILNHMTCDDMLKFLLKKSVEENFSFEGLQFEDMEEEQLFEVVKLLPLTAVVDRIEFAIDSGELNIQELSILSQLTVPQLMAELVKRPSQKDEDSKLKDELITNLLTSVSTEKVLKYTANKLETSGEMASKSVKLLHQLSSNYLPEESIIDIVQNRYLPEKEKSELLEYLVSLSPTENILSRLPIKDMIQYYEKLVVTPECKAPLLRTSLENATESDLIRFCSSDKVLRLVKAQLEHKPPMIKPSQLAKLLPPPKSDAEVVASFNDSEETVNMLKEHFSANLLMALVASYVLKK